MYAKVSRGFRPSCKNRGASALRGFCPRTKQCYVKSLQKYWGLYNKFHGLFEIKFWFTNNESFMRISKASNVTFMFFIIYQKPFLIIMDNGHRENVIKAWKLESQQFAIKTWKRHRPLLSELQSTFDLIAIKTWKPTHTRKPQTQLQLWSRTPH